MWADPRTTPSVETHGLERPRVLRILAALFLVTTFFDRLIFSDVALIQNASSVVAFALVATYAIWLLRHGRIPFNRPIAYFGLFVMFTAILQLFKYTALPGSIDPEEFRAYFQYVQNFFIYFVVFDVARDVRTIRTMAVAFVVVTSVMAILGITVGSEVANSGRVGVSDINLNRQAFFYTQAIIGIFCWLLARWPRFGRGGLSASLTAALCVVALVNTGSRGGTATLLFGLGLSSVVFFQGRKLPVYLSLMPVAFLAIGALLMSSQLLQERFNATTEGDTGLRAELFEASTQMIGEKPLIGWGANYTDELNDRLDRYRDDPIASHNTYTQIPVTFGLLAFVPWILAVVATLRLSWSARGHEWDRLLFVLLVSALVMGASMSLGYTKYFWVLLAVVGGTASASVSPGPSRGQRQGRSTPLASGTAV